MYATKAITALRIVRPATALVTNTSICSRRLTLSGIKSSASVNSKQVHITIHEPVKSSIPVAPLDGKFHAVPNVPMANGMEVLRTLKDEAYNALPKTVKSMTVKGKVIIITGKLSFSFACLLSSSCPRYQHCFERTLKTAQTTQMLMAIL